MSFKGAALDVLEAFGWFVVTERYFMICALVFPHFCLFGAFWFFLNRVFMFLLRTAKNPFQHPNQESTLFPR